MKVVSRCYMIRNWELGTKIGYRMSSPLEKGGRGLLKWHLWSFVVINSLIVKYI
jgi:hypothetical protein